MANYRTAGGRRAHWEKPKHLNLYADDGRVATKALCGQRGVHGPLIKLWVPGTIQGLEGGVTCERCLVSIDKRRREARFPNIGNPLRAG